MCILFTAAAADRFAADHCACEDSRTNKIMLPPGLKELIMGKNVVEKVESRNWNEFWAFVGKRTRTKYCFLEGGLRELPEERLMKSLCL